MFLVEHETKKDSFLRENEISHEMYQHRLSQHQKNACAYVKSTKLIYDAICLSQNKNINKWAWHYNYSEDHPAIMKLCVFWDYYLPGECQYESRVPYVQLFLGNEYYKSLIENDIHIPIKIKNNQTQNYFKMSSAVFGKNFLITYLAGRDITARYSKKDYLIHYTVHGVPLFKERLLFSNNNLFAFDNQNQLAFKTLNALHEFPIKFPTLWEKLKKENEEKHYEVH